MSAARLALIRTSSGLLWAILPLLVASVLLTTAAAGPGVLPGDAVATREIQEVAVPGSDDLARMTNWVGDGAQITVLATSLAFVLWGTTLPLCLVGDN